MQCHNELKEEIETPTIFQLEPLSKPVHYPGIAIYTADMGKNKLTDVNSEWVVRTNSTVSTTSEIIRNKFNAMHKIYFENLKDADDYVEFVVALHGKLVNRIPVPSEFLNNLSGISFRAVSYNVPITITLQVFDINGVLIKSQHFDVTKNKITLFKMDINNSSVHHLSFKVLGSNQKTTPFSRGAFAIDDIYLNNASNVAFLPPSDNTQLLKWMKESSLRYFLWNYVDLGGNRGVVLEASDDPTKVSLSGIGYAYAMYILAEKEGMIDAQTAKKRIVSILNWQKDQNWFNGSQGKFGFPFHYYNSNGSGLYNTSPEAVSTIDWAICAAGIRTAKQKYASDSEIVAICDELLNRPEWEKTVHTEVNDTYKYGRITKGLHGTSGVKNGQVWADAFSEETELIYLEALASGKINNLDLNRIFRATKNGIYVSWFGAGFTYNWMQLWTGKVAPYETNSINAYQVEASTCASAFGIPLLGLTACSTISDVNSSGFVNWDRYISNQGSSISGATSAEVIQISPAPYGAVLALPFIPNTAINALKEYINIGYYHPLLGLPDNVRMSKLPSTLSSPIPNWSTFDINIGPIAMAVDMYQQKNISKLYLNDAQIKNSIEKLIKSF